MNFKLRNGVLSIYDVENVVFIDIFGGRRIRIALSVEKGFFDGIINIDSLSKEYRMVVNLLIKMKYMVSCDADERIRKIVVEFYDEKIGEGL